MIFVVRPSDCVMLHEIEMIVIFNKTVPLTLVTMATSEVQRPDNYSKSR